ncbi:PREDICTED: transmembrane protein 68-like [Nipponia nippon]|uniref:transmembrane protein 68-like n=1 Tax=Nipponia nippon TaxID=128390 RepID=UPI00051125C1|nr:PREDICTED: transmembrane protein 68-like [Nipponia nippon]
MLFVPEVFLPGLLYPFSLLLHIYKRKDGLKGHYSNELWDRRWQMVTYLWNLSGKLWNYMSDLAHKKVILYGIIVSAKTVVQTLRDRHEKPPENMLRALLERFHEHQKVD